MFLALLITWTPQPAHVIEGVQGRYFLIPAIMVAYAVAGSGPVVLRWRRDIALILCFGLFLISLSGTVDLLLGRFYLMPAPQQTCTGTLGMREAACGAPDRGCAESGGLSEVDVRVVAG